ncbi:MAG: branched-chain amino acid ABC transporter permease [Acidimicrobiales bacterium]
MHPGLLLSAVVTGVATGSLYAMVAIGYTVVYNATRVFNLAQGQLVMMSVMLSYLLLVIARWSVVPTFFAVVLAAGLASMFEERIIVRPLLRLGHSRIGWLIATLAFSIIIETVAADVYGYNPPRAIPSPVKNHVLHLGPISLSTQYLLVLAALVVVVAVVEIFYNRTWTGQAMRATAEDREAASLFGIEPARMGLTAFALGGVVAGIAGFVIAPVVFANVSVGLTYTLEGFLAMAVGGFGSLRGAIIGALLLGVVTEIWDLYLGSQLDLLAGLGLLVLVLALRPAGLLGRQAARVV